MLKYWLKVFQSEYDLLSNTISNCNTYPDGLLIDMPTAQYYYNVFDEVRLLSKNRNIKVYIDPLTFKIGNPNFKDKKTYNKVDYFRNAPSSKTEMIKTANYITNSIVEFNQKFETNTVLGPYIYLNKKVFTEPKYFEMQDKFNEEFSKLAPKQYDKYYYLYLASDILNQQATFDWINRFINNYSPKKVYLRISNYVIGRDPGIDKGIIKLLGLFGSKKIETIYSHGPAWVYVLFAKGLIGFSSGIGHQSIDKHYDTDSEKRKIEKWKTAKNFGVKYNIYVQKGFCKLNPDNYQKACDMGIVELCKCKVCNGSIPTENSHIRIHSVYSRLDEIRELDNCCDIQNTLINWITESKKLIYQLNSNRINFTQDTTPNKMLTFLQL